MNETYLSQVLKDKLTKAGFYVRKVGGTAYSASLPDMYVCRRGVTIFIEVKLFKEGSTTAFIPTSLGVTNQMLMMIDHERKALAMYLIFVTKGNRYWCMDFHPSELLKSIKTSQPIYRPFKEVDTWVRENLSSLFPQNQNQTQNQQSSS